MTVSFKVKGLEQLLKKLDGANGTIRKELNDAMAKSVFVVHERAKTYPPQRPGSTYKRKKSAGLGGAWDTEVKSLASDIKGIVSNPTSYGPYVMLEERQAWMHKGRWATTVQIVKEKQHKIMGFFEYAMDRIANSFE